MDLGKITPKQILIGLGVAALAFRSRFNPIVIDPNIARRYFNRLLVNVVAFKIQGNSLLLAIRIDNPNPTAISLQSIVGQVYFRNRLLGDVAYYQKQAIQPLANTNVTLGIRLKDPTILFYLAQMLTSGLRGEKIDFVGNISVNGQVLAVQETFNFKR